MCRKWGRYVASPGRAAGAACKKVALEGDRVPAIAEETFDYDAHSMQIALRRGRPFRPAPEGSRFAQQLGSVLLQAFRKRTRDRFTGHRQQLKDVREVAWRKS